jgi:hypothetical protein
MDNKDLQLQKEVSDKYDLVGVKVGTRQFSGFGTIDLTKVDVKHADALVSMKFPHFIVKNPDKPVLQVSKPADTGKAGADAAAK